MVRNENETFNEVKNEIDLLTPLHLIVIPTSTKIMMVVVVFTL